MGGGERNTLSAVLFRAKPLELLQFFLQHRETQYSVNELAQKTGISYNTVDKVVKQFHAFGIVNMQEKGGANLVSLNTDSTYLPALEQIGRVDAESLREAAERYVNDVVERVGNVLVTAVLFGSVARGLPTADSDVDVLLLVDKQQVVEGDAFIDRGDVQDTVQSIADRYRREQKTRITPVVMYWKQFWDAADNNEAFARNVLRDGILLHRTTDTKTGTWREQR